jgi:Mn2+/Fe2+ NRAMP family transporter
LLVLIVLLASDREIMKERVSGLLSKSLSWVAAAIMAAAAVGLGYTTFFQK